MTMDYLAVSSLWQTVQSLYHSQHHVNGEPHLGETAPVTEALRDTLCFCSVLGDLCKEYFTYVSSLGAQEQKKKKKPSYCSLSCL